MVGVAASHRANYDTGGDGNIAEPLQSVGDLFVGVIGWGGVIDEFHDKVRHLLFGGEVFHNQRLATPPFNLLPLSPS